MGYRVTAFVLALSALTINSQINDYPIIGILSVPLDSAEVPCATVNAPPHLLREGTAPSCFSSFYVQWVESAGARAIVIPYNANHSTLDRLFASVNGLLFTGGGTDLFFNGTYLQTADYLFQKVLAANRGGDFFPLHGTCMGMQTISILAARNESVLSLHAFNSENISWPLNFTEAAYTSRVIGEAPEFVVTTFASTNSTLNLHHDGVPPSVYAENPKMAELLVMLATNRDRDGKQFVSMWEGRGLPITATQFHPERVIFEWRLDIGINHATDATLANRYLGDFFIAQSKRNMHVFDPALGPEFSVYGYNSVLVKGMDVMTGYMAYYFAF